jgi:hypothetical protein
MLDRCYLVDDNDDFAGYTTDTEVWEDFLFSLEGLEGNFFLGLFLYSGLKKNQLELRRKSLWVNYTVEDILFIANLSWIKRE